MSHRHCSDCESPLHPDAPEGICPECLMQVGTEFSQDTTLSIRPIDDTREEDFADTRRWAPSGRSCFPETSRLGTPALYLANSPSQAII